MDVWALNESGGVVGGKRLMAQLVKSATLLAVYPELAINANVEGDEVAVNSFEDGKRYMLERVQKHVG